MSKILIILGTQSFPLAQRPADQMSHKTVSWIMKDSLCCPPGVPTTLRLGSEGYLEAGVKFTCDESEASS